ncbi:MAG TPA: hypothetical protein VFT93_07230, partial [Candidatus Eisenbacteria bacterium]|nr:hypothetical protein [Candidatus Eisenbacteria bacterium]
MSLISNLLSPKRLSGVVSGCLAAVSGLAAVLILGLPSLAPAGQIPGTVVAQADPAAAQAAPSDTAAAPADSSQPVEE